MKTFFNLFIDLEKKQAVLQDGSIGNPTMLEGQEAVSQAMVLLRTHFPDEFARGLFRSAKHQHLNPLPKKEEKAKEIHVHN